MEHRKSWINYLFLIILLQIIVVNCVELTFELADNAKDCFYQEIAKNQTATLEFQVNILIK